tara:strand:- start:458 stop:655 length:198 start_codon:yes stop_codon:yes gene_type:complete
MKKLSKVEREYIKEVSEFRADDYIAMELTRIRHEMGNKTPVGVSQVKRARIGMGIKRPPGRRRGS